MSLIGDLGSSILGAAYAVRVPLAIVGVAAAVLLLFLARRRGWVRLARRHPVVSTLLVAAVALVASPVAWYLVSPIFVRTELREPPVVAAAEPSPMPAPVSPATSPTPAVEETTDPTAPPAPTATPWAPATPRTGSFEGTDDFHFGRGTAILAETAPGEWVVRFEDFSVRNGPDLYVYLSPDPDGYGEGAIEVARLKATDGSFNTRVPAGADVSGVRSVLIWCKQFSHLFAFATLDG